MLVALLGAAACGTGDQGEGTLNELEDQAAEVEGIRPDTTGTGYKMGPGGGSVDDTMQAPPVAGDTAVHEAVDSAMQREGR